MTSNPWPAAADSEGAAEPAWGAYRPGLSFRAVLGLSRLVPQLPLIKQLAFCLRRLGRSLHSWVDVRHWGLRLRLRTRGSGGSLPITLGPGRYSWMWGPIELRTRLNVGLRRI